MKFTKTMKTNNKNCSTCEEARKELYFPYVSFC